MMMPGKEAGLGDAEQETQDIELHRSLHEGAGCRDDAPADQDARDPDARAVFVERDVARYLE
ncbi:hypothetical protein ACVWXN_007916 [Bradyrhizobium sp. i1.4.4]